MPALASREDALGRLRKNRPRKTRSLRRHLRLARAGRDPGGARAPLQQIRGGPPLRRDPSRRVMSTPRDTPEITLVGAGLAGSLMAIFLARRGHRVTLLERRPDPRKMPESISAGRSINLALANRGIAALEEVGVMESLRPELIPMAGRMLHDEEGRLRLIPYGNKPHEVIYSVSRGGLNALLVDAAEATDRVS